MRAACLSVVIMVRVASLCTDETDCNLLGKCESGSCVCSPGWKGERCGVADLAPAAPPESNGYHNETANSWGGRAIYSGGQWHLIATEMTNSCPLQDFDNNSQVIRAVSEHVTGPFQRVETVFPPFHHNPTVTRSPDGYFLIYFIILTFDHVKEKG